MECNYGCLIGQCTHVQNAVGNNYFYGILSEERERRRKEAGPYLFVIGQKVQLCSAGPIMTVVGHHKVPHTEYSSTASVECRWFTTDGRLQQAAFTVDTLSEA